MDQKAIYRQFNGAIFNTCYRILHNREEAEECMQDAFVKLFGKRAPVFVNEAACYGWLKKVAVNGALDRLNSLDFRMSSQGTSIDTPRVRVLEEPTSAAESATDMALHQKVEQVKQALFGLPAGYRTILSLYLFDGYDFEEIAQITRLQPSTVRSQYTRGRQKLQELIPQELWTR